MTSFARARARARGVACCVLVFVYLHANSNFTLLAGNAVAENFSCNSRVLLNLVQEKSQLQPRN